MSHHAARCMHPWYSTNVPQNRIHLRPLKSRRLSWPNLQSVEFAAPAPGVAATIAQPAHSSAPQMPHQMRIPHLTAQPCINHGPADREVVEVLKALGVDSQRVMHHVVEVADRKSVV